MRICNAINALGLGLSAIGSLCIPGVTHAGVSSGQTNVAVIATGTLVKVDDLDFGSIAPFNTNGSVTVTPQGARSATGGATLLGTSFAPAIFAGKGARRNQQVTINFGAPSIVITRSGGTEQMTVNNFTLGAAPDLAIIASGRRFRITPANAAFQFTVGATLLVGANQVPGDYSGTVSVTVTYQ